MTRRRKIVLVALATVVLAVGAGGVWACAAVRHARTSEATYMLSGIKLGEEVYRSENGRYLDVSAGSLRNTHPPFPPERWTRPWNAAGPASDGFATLFEGAGSGFQPAPNVYFNYAVVAGTGTIPRGVAPAGIDVPPNGKDSHWYVAVATGDLDGDGKYQYFVTASSMRTVETFGDDE